MGSKLALRLGSRIGHSLCAAAVALSAALSAPGAAAADEPEALLAERIERAHGVEAWRQQRGVAANLLIEMGGQRMLEGRVLFTPEVGRARLELADGTVAVYDGEQAWVSPANAPLQMARFHLLAWPYFIAAPFKLNDPGANLESLGSRELQGRTYNAAKLTFAPGTGDAPDDWYVIYADPDTHRLQAMAYIVTYGQDREEAEREPHAILFEDFTTLEGVALARRWSFWHWSEEEGIHGEPIGRGELTEIRFVEPQAGAFERPKDARKDALPRPATAPAR